MDITKDKIKQAEATPQSIKEC